MVIWDEKNSDINKAIDDAIDSGGNESDVIVANYDDQHRANQVGLRERLRSLETEILSRAVPA